MISGKASVQQALFYAPSHLTPGPLTPEGGTTALRPIGFIHPSGVRGPDSVKEKLKFIFQTCNKQTHEGVT